MLNLQIRTRFLLTATTCFVLGILASPPVFANAGIPLIALISPGFWLILPLVILLESFLVLIILRKGIWTALKVAAISNIFSTVAGVPLRWLVALALTPLANQQSHLSNEYASGTTINKFAFTIIDAPWGFTGTPENWIPEMMICWGILLVPFLLLSVWIEGQVAVRLVAKEDRKRARCWALLANIASYALLFMLFTRLFGFVWEWVV